MSSRIFQYTVTTKYSIERDRESERVRLLQNLFLIWFLTTRHSSHATTTTTNLLLFFFTLYHTLVAYRLIVRCGSGGEIALE